MESTNNKEDNVPTRHLMPPCKTFSAKNGLHLVELLAKGPHEKPQASQAITKGIGYSPQSAGKAF